MVLLVIFILAMAVISIFVYRRGWKQTPRWLRLYVWCALVVEPIELFAILTGLDLDPDRPGPALMVLGLLLVMFANLILIWSAAPIAGVLLVRMITPTVEN